MFEKIRSNIILNIFMVVLTAAMMLLYIWTGHAGFIMGANVCGIYWVIYFVLRLIKAEREESLEVGHERTVEELEAIIELRAERKRKRQARLRRIGEDIFGVCDLFAEQSMKLFRIIVVLVILFCLYVLYVRIGVLIFGIMGGYFCLVILYQLLRQRSMIRAKERRIKELKESGIIDEMRGKEETDIEVDTDE